MNFIGIEFFLWILNVLTWLKLNVVYMVEQRAPRAGRVISLKYSTKDKIGIHVTPRSRTEVMLLKPSRVYGVQIL